LEDGRRRTAKSHGVLDKPLSGILFFPVTPFSSGGELDLDVLRTHLERGLAHRPGGVFVACGTGEFHALSRDEYRDVVSTAVGVVSGAVPVFSGVGGQLPVMEEQAKMAEAAGIDGLLVMPPYLVRSPADGLYSYISSLAEKSNLPLIVYNRENATLDVATAVRLAEIPSVMGVKDGVGDLDRFGRIVLGIRNMLSQKADPKAFQFFNGLATAETTQRAYRGIGVDLYSSAVFGFAPEIARAFWNALEAGDRGAGDRLLTQFYGPLVELRDQVPGYAVSLVKAGVRLSGLDVGSVRPPLLDPSSAHTERLRQICQDGHAAIDDRHTTSRSRVR
jgi:5-dehydro-4-deoxyglucarate dehydratase